MNNKKDLVIGSDTLRVIYVKRYKEYRLEKYTKTINGYLWLVISRYNSKLESIENYNLNIKLGLI